MENYNRTEESDYAIYYYLNDKYHRIDGPAIKFIDGTKYWYQNGKCHRIDGPAIEYSNGEKYWFYEGEETDCKLQEEFERYLKLKLFW
jgi:hypothetical protein